jgi:hypothetical protein
MHVDPALLSPISALFGALIGGSTSLVAAVYTQRGKDRLQRIATEIAKRETVYADFVIHASNLLLHAYTNDEVELSGHEQRLIGLLNRMRFFAPPNVVAVADKTLRAIIAISLKPKIELRQLAMQALSQTLDDPVLEFSSVCRADLDSVHRTMA